MKFFKSARVIGWAIAIGFIVVLIMVFNASCQLQPVPTPTPALAPVISGYQMCIARVSADFRTTPNDPQLEVRVCQCRQEHSFRFDDNCQRIIDEVNND